MTPIRIKDLDLAIETKLSELEPKRPMISTPVGGGPCWSTLQEFLEQWEQLPECEAKHGMLIELEKHLVRRKQVVDAIVSGIPLPLGF